MTQPLVFYGDARLRQPGKPVNKITVEIQQLINDLLETMRAAHGVGLAAQQVGKALQVAVIDVTGVKERESKMWINDKPVDPELHMPIILINPKITGTKKKVLGPEGCLSFPDISVDIPRSQRVTVVTQTLDGGIFKFDAAGLLGRACQHEYDHLHGKLLLDMMTPQQRTEWKIKLDEIQAMGHASRQA